MKMIPGVMVRCSLCGGLLIPTVRWRGYTPVFVGYVCRNTLCGHSVGGAAQPVGEA